MDEKSFEKSKVFIKEFVTLLRDAMCDLKNGTEATKNLELALDSLKNLQAIVMECETGESKEGA